MDDPENRSGSGTGNRTDPRTQPSSGPPSGDDPKQAAKEQGKQLADDAREHAQEVAGTAKEGAREVLGEATQQVSDLAADARQQLHQQARQQTDHLGETLKGFGGKLHALADGNPDEAGQVGAYADQLADQVERIGRRVADLGFDGTVDELQRFARRRPGMFLLGAATAGFAVSRIGRGVKDAQQHPEDRRGQQDQRALQARPARLEGTSRPSGSGQERSFDPGGREQHASPSSPPRSGQAPDPLGGRTPTPTSTPTGTPRISTPVPPPPIRPAPDPSQGRGQP